VSIRFDGTRLQKIPEVSPATYAALAVGDSVPLALMLEAQDVPELVAQHLLPGFIGVVV
jgi:hypothetical protein